MKIIATIEARMTSTRLPGKVLLPANNQPMISHLIHRLQAVKSIQGIVLATTTNPQDDCLVSLAKELNIKVFRGSEEDVMSRVIEAGSMVNADIIVEICGDCPIIDPILVEQTIQLFLHNDCEYASNCKTPSYPIGMNTHVVYLQALKKSFAMTDDLKDREHVTRHIHRHPELFKQVYLVAPEDLYWPDLALTLDEEADYKLLKKIIEYFPKNPVFDCRSIIDLLQNIHPEWVSINDFVRRKTLDE